MISSFGHLGKFFQKSLILVQKGKIHQRKIIFHTVTGANKLFEGKLVKKKLVICRGYLIVLTLSGAIELYATV